MKLISAKIRLHAINKTAKIPPTVLILMDLRVSSNFTATVSPNVTNTLMPPKIVSSHLVPSTSTLLQSPRPTCELAHISLYILKLSV